MITLSKEEFLRILEEYTDMRREIKKLQNKLVQNGYKRHAVIRGVDLLRLNRIERLEIILQNRYNRLLEKQNQVEQYLDTLKSDIRQILGHRYIDDMSWVQVQIAMRI